MAETASIHVRIGEHEFKAEGPAELVRTQYDQFLKTIGRSQAVGDEPQCSLPVSLVAKAFRRASAVFPRIPSFALQGRDPQEQRSNFLLTVLYAPLAIDGIRDVSATDLINVMRSRGLGADEDRIDRLISAHSGLVVKSGVKRGSRYGLTQSGVEFVEKLIAEGLAKKIEPKKD